MTTRKPTVGHGAASSGACGHPSAWPVLRRLPWPRRFLAKAIRGPEPGAPVLEPLHLTRVLGPPPDVYLNSLLSFFVFLYLSVCEASFQVTVTSVSQQTIVSLSLHTTCLSSIEFCLHHKHHYTIDS